MQNIAKVTLELAPYFVTNDDMMNIFEWVQTNMEIKEIAMEMVDSIFNHTEISPAQFKALQHIKRCIQWTVPGGTPKVIDFEAKAKSAFEAYQRAVGYVAKNGATIPTWDALLDEVKSRWIAAVKAIA